MISLCWNIVVPWENGPSVEVEHVTIAEIPAKIWVMVGTAPK
jgi:hypothetical protein